MRLRQLKPAPSAIWFLPENKINCHRPLPTKPLRSWPPKRFNSRRGNSPTRLFFRHQMWAWPWLRFCLCLKSSEAPPTLLYCWLHGYNQSHASADCRGCEPGASMYKRYGIRDDDRCFSHANCQHDPPCISSADAKRATKPESYPETPGSTYEWRARGAATTAKRSA